MKILLICLIALFVMLQSPVQALDTSSYDSELSDDEEPNEQESSFRDNEELKKQESIFRDNEELKEQESIFRDNKGLEDSQGYNEDL